MAEQTQQSQTKSQNINPSLISRNDYLELVRNAHPSLSGKDDKTLWFELTTQRPELKSIRFKDSIATPVGDLSGTAVFLDEFNKINNKALIQPEDKVNRGVSKSIFKETAKIYRDGYGFDYIGTLPLNLEHFPTKRYNTPEGIMSSNIVTQYDTDSETNPTEWTLYPAMQGGRLLTNDEIDANLRDGKHFGKYSSLKELEAADVNIHKRFDKISQPDYVKVGERDMAYDQKTGVWNDEKAQIARETGRIYGMAYENMLNAPIMQTDWRSRWEFYRDKVGIDYNLIHEPWRRELTEVEKFLGYTIGQSLTGEIINFLLDPVTDKEIFPREIKDYNPGEIAKVAAIVLSFLLPFDKLAFLKGGRAVSKPVRMLKDRAVKIYTNKGIPLKAANNMVNAGWLQLLERVGMTAGGMGAHSSFTSYFSDMNDGEIQSAKDFMQNYASAFAVGGTASFGGATVGRVLRSRLGNFRPRLAISTVADFLTEVVIFATLGPNLNRPEGADPFDWEEFTDSFAHTTGVLLGIRFLLGGAKGYPSKLAKGDGAKIEKQLREEFGKNGGDMIEATKTVAEQMEIPLDMNTKILAKHEENKSDKQIELLESEVQKVIEDAKLSARERKEQKIKSEEAQYTLDKTNAVQDIELALREGRWADAADIALSVRKEGDRPDALILEARDNINLGKNKKFRRFINLAVHAANQRAAGRKDYAADGKEYLRTNKQLSDNKAKGQTELWIRRLSKPTEQIYPTASSKAVLTKSKDMRTPKGEVIIEGGKTKVYKASKRDGGATAMEKAQDAAEKLRRKTVNIGRNLIFRYTVKPNGDIAMKVTESKRDIRGKREVATKLEPRNLTVEENKVDRVRNPWDAKSTKERILLLEAEKSDLTYGLGKHVEELEFLRRSLKEGDSRVQQKLDAIEAARALLRANEKDRLDTMTSIELMEATKKNLPPFKVGLGIKDVREIREDVAIESHFKEIVKQWIKRGQAAGRGANSFIDWLARQGLKDPAIKAYVKDHFEDMKVEIGVDHAFKILKIVDTATGGELAPGGIPRPAKLDQATEDMTEVERNVLSDYSGGRKISMHEQSFQDIIKKVHNQLIGRDRDEEKIRKRGNIDEIRAMAKRRDIKREVFKLVVEGKNSALDFDKHVMLLIDNLKTVRDLWMTDPDNINYMQLFTVNLEALHKMATVWGKTGKVLQDDGRVDAETFAAILNLNKAGAIKTADLFEMVNKMYSMGDVTPQRSALWKFAELSRNMKLLSISSFAKSVIGNTAMLVMETAARAARPMFAKTFSILSGRDSGISRHEIWNRGMTLTAGSGAFRNGLINPEVGGFRVAWELLKENDVYVRDNPYLTNEGFGRDIKGILGKTIRLPQNMHGALDAIFRLPWTSSWAYTLAQRWAVRKLRADGKRLHIRDVAELTQKYLMENHDYFYTSAKAKAREQVYQKELGQWGRSINAVRTGSGPGHALANMSVPFVVTYVNVFKKIVEFSPLGYLAKPVRQIIYDTALRPFYGKKSSKGDPDLAAEYAARASVGLAIMIITSQVIDKILNNKVQGSWSDNSRQEKELKTNLGLTEYGIDINGINQDIRGIDPISLYLQAVIAYSQTEDDVFYKRMISAGTDLAEYLNNHPIAMLTSDWAQMNRDEKSRGRIIGRLTSSMWQPTLFRQLGRLADPTRYRDVMEGDVTTDGHYYTADFFPISRKSAPWNTIMTYNTKLLGKWKDTRYPQQDLFGRPVVQKSSYGLLFGVRQYQIKEDKVYNEYLKLFDNQKEVTKFANIGSIIESGNIKIKLSHEEQYLLNHYVGVAYYNLIEEMIETEWYKEGPNYGRVGPDGKPESDENWRRELWLNARNKNYLEIIKDGSDAFVTVGVVEFVKHYMLRDLHLVAQTLNDIDTKVPKVDKKVGDATESYKMQLKILAPDLTDKQAEEVVRLVRLGANFGGLNFKTAISIVRRAMPRSRRDIIDEAETVERFEASRRGAVMQEEYEYPTPQQYGVQRGG